MASFSLFETFFFLTLAITFALILLLVYHFKDRLSKLEQKNDQMFEIIQGLMEEMIKIRNSNRVVLGPSLEQYNLNQTMENDLEESEIDVRKIEHINLSDIGATLVDDEESDDEESETAIDEGEESEDEESESEESDDGTTIEKIDIPSMEEKPIDYKKITVAELREMVTAKGLSDNANKLKKGELVELLQQ